MTEPADQGQSHLTWSCDSLGCLVWTCSCGLSGDGETPEGIRVGRAHEAICLQEQR